MMRLLKSISINKDGIIIVEDAENGERREFDSMNDALESIGKEKNNDIRTSE